MGKSPAFQFYPRDWLGDPEIMLMDWDARAMHLHCMCIAWMQADACALPNNDAILMRWLGVNNSDDWEKRLKPQIFSAWKLEGGNWIQTRLKREKIKQLEFSEKRKKAADARWKNNVAPHDASAMQVECSSSSSSTAVVKENFPTESKRKSQKKSQQFKKPTREQLCEYAQQRNFQHFDPDDFLDYYESNGWKVGRNAMKSWPHAASKWERENAKRTATRKQPTQSRSRAEQFLDACKEYAGSDADDMDSEPVRKTSREVRTQVVEFIPRRLGETGNG